MRPLVHHWPVVFTILLALALGPYAATGAPFNDNDGRARLLDEYTPSSAEMEMRARTPAEPGDGEVGAHPVDDSRGQEDVTSRKIAEENARSPLVVQMSQERGRRGRIKRGHGAEESQPATSLDANNHVRSESILRPVGPHQSRQLPATSEELGMFVPPGGNAQFYRMNILAARRGETRQMVECARENGCQKFAEEQQLNELWDSSLTAQSKIPVMEEPLPEPLPSRLVKRLSNIDSYPLNIFAGIANPLTANSPGTKHTPAPGIRTPATGLGLFARDLKSNLPREEGKTDFEAENRYQAVTPEELEMVLNPQDVEKYKKLEQWGKRFRKLEGQKQKAEREGIAFKDEEKLERAKYFNDWLGEVQGQIQDKLIKSGKARPEVVERRQKETFTQRDEDRRQEIARRKVQTRKDNQRLKSLENKKMTEDGLTAEELQEMKAIHARAEDTRLRTLQAQYQRKWEKRQRDSAERRQTDAQAEDRRQATARQRLETKSDNQRLKYLEDKQKTEEGLTSVEKKEVTDILGRRQRKHVEMRHRKNAATKRNRQNRRDPPRLISLKDKYTKEGLTIEEKREMDEIVNNQQAKDRPQEAARKRAKTQLDNERLKYLDDKKMTKDGLTAEESQEMDALQERLRRNPRLDYLKDKYVENGLTPDETQEMNDLLGRRPSNGQAEDRQQETSRKRQMTHLGNQRLKYLEEKKMTQEGLTTDELQEMRDIQERHQREAEENRLQYQENRKGKEKAARQRDSAERRQKDEQGEDQRQEPARKRENTRLENQRLKYLNDKRKTKGGLTAEEWQELDDIYEARRREAEVKRLQKNEYVRLWKQRSKAKSLAQEGDDNSNGIDPPVNVPSAFKVPDQQENEVEMSTGKVSLPNAFMNKISGMGRNLWDNISKVAGRLTHPPGVVGTATPVVGPPAPALRLIPRVLDGLI
ncbi:MAG: hypothetical protein M1816_000208 [Peltula sp. TS41687]|nr:MAG: hypothetical protein M1816_000208 [Peltula sp. TS41687]